MNVRGRFTGRVFVWLTVLIVATGLVVACGADETSSDDEGGETDFLLGTSVSESDLEKPTGPTGQDRMVKPQLGPNERYEVELGENTDFVDNHPMLASLQFDGMEVVKAMPKQGKKLPFAKGRILLSQRGRFARKVVGIYQKDGQYNIKTVPAKLEEIYSSLDIEGEALLLPEIAAQAPLDIAHFTGEVGTQTFPIEASGTKEATKTFTLTKGVIDQPKVKLNLKGDLDVAAKVKVKLYWKPITDPGNAQFMLWVKFNADSNVVATLKAEIEWALENHLDMDVWSFPWTIGVVSGTVDMDIILNYGVGVEGDVIAKVDMGFEGWEMKVGAEWHQEDGWEGITDYTNPTWTHGHSVEGSATAYAMVNPMAYVAVTVYGIEAAVELGMGPELRAEVEATGSIGGPGGHGGAGAEICMNLWGALKTQTLFVLEVFGYTLGSWEINDSYWPPNGWDLFEKCWSI